MTFVSYLPVIEESQQKLCDLLLATRLGLQNIDQSAFGAFYAFDRAGLGRPKGPRVQELRLVF